jgi:hypothetical protein
MPTKKLRTNGARGSGSRFTEGARAAMSERARETKSRSKIRIERGRSGGAALSERLPGARSTHIRTRADVIKSPLVGVTSLATSSVDDEETVDFEVPQREEAQSTPATGPNRSAKACGPPAPLTLRAGISAPSWAKEDSPHSTRIPVASDPLATISAPRCEGRSFMVRSGPLIPRESLNRRVQPTVPSASVRSTRSPTLPPVRGKGELRHSARAVHGSREPARESRKSGSFSGARGVWQGESKDLRASATTRWPLLPLTH